jgi:hypothetical protein
MDATQGRPLWNHQGICPVEAIIALHQRLQRTQLTSSPVGSSISKKSFLTAENVAVSARQAVNNAIPFIFKVFHNSFLYFITV